MNGMHLFQDEWLVRAASTLPAAVPLIEKLRAERHPDLFNALVESGAVGVQELHAAIQTVNRVRALGTEAVVERPVAALVGERLCRRYCIAPIRVMDESIEVAMANPLDLEALADVQAVSGRTPVPLYAPPQKIEELLAEAYSPEIVVYDLLDKLQENATVEVLGENEGAVDNGDVRAPIVKLVGSLIAKAYHMRASDIHLEHDEHSSIVRFRIDGSLKTIMTLPHYVGAGPTVSRIKILANLDIADRLRPQDGRAKVRIGPVEIGLRVSTLPTNFGEKVVIRLLDKRAAEVPFEKLGFRPDLAARLGALLKSAQGLLLVTGPTGSGKTTTLYSILSRLKSDDTNIVTVEDPVEYKLDGINQTQVQEKQGLTFAAVLRSVLRQDPDVILVGEIRDRETADTAMQAALTGHLVVSSLHTNDALGTITRLADMGVERFKLAPALIAVTAQRLIRSLCPACRVPGPEPEAGIAAAQRERGLAAVQFMPKGCAACDFQGYKGRIGLVELLEMTPGLRARIIAGDGEGALRAFALAEKSLSTLLDDAVWRLSRGETTLAEVVPYVQLPENPGGATPAPVFAPALADLPAATAPSEAPLAAAGTGPRVLVADDDATIRIILRKVLEGLGCRVIEAVDGEKALASIAGEAPDMVLVDLNMPGLDGYGVIRGVRQSLGLAKVPILMLTSQSDDKSQAQAFELGADDYIIKPVKIPIVTARVKAAFRRLSS
jgi:type II secretory ATPase GspE/PulE/Tfp pilus assembly ATPase PilB-like protein